MIIAKKHRLENDLYMGEKIISFTILVKSESLLNSNYYFSKLKNLIIESSKKENCNILIFLCMPDHIHLILQGNNKNSNLLSVIKSFKQFSGFYLKKLNSNFKWHTSFYDHIVRANEDLKNQIYYILYNPIRKEICDDWKDYKFKYSDIYEFDKWDL
ncbi:MAG TPA: transposase [Ignavibacteria bacterium]|nr:transposase [Ignavibacteria bacterium]